MSIVAEKVEAPPRKARDESKPPHGGIRIKIEAEVNITAKIARRLVNVELMLKVGQMIMAGEPEQTRISCLKRVSTNRFSVLICSLNQKERGETTNPCQTSLNSSNEPFAI